MDLRTMVYYRRVTHQLEKGAGRNVRDGQLDKSNTAYYLINVYSRRIPVQAGNITSYKYPTSFNERESSYFPLRSLTTSPRQRSQTSRCIAFFLRCIQLESCLAERN